MQHKRPANRRYGYMGHITLLTEQILLSLNHFPEDLVSELVEFVPQPAWDEYIHDAFCVAKAKDAAKLGGGKPVVSSIKLSGSRWAKVDEQDDVIGKGSDESSSRGSELPSLALKSPSIKGEFRRVSAFRQGSRSYNADFGAPFTQTFPQSSSSSEANHQVRSIFVS
jgi:serine/threonine-protein phosphatase 6 regulatory subunit 3